MATIKQRPNGTWQAQVRKSGHAPKTKTFSTKALAEVWARKIESEIERGVAGMVGDQITVMVLLDKWVDEVADTRRGGDLDRMRVARFQRTADISLLAMPCNNPTLVDRLREWRNGRIKEVSGSSVNREINLLSTIFSHGIKEGWLKGMSQNPWSLISRPAHNPPRKQRCSEEQLIKIVGPMPTKKPETLADFLAYVAWIAVLTTMRRGEILQLQWKNINVKERAIELEHGNGKSTKTGVARMVPLSKQACELIQTLADHFEDADWEDKIFPGEPHSYTTQWRKQATAVGLGHIRLHDQRREGASRLAKKMPVHMLAKVTGHQDIGVLQNTYYQPETKELAEMMD